MGTAAHLKSPLDYNVLVRWSSPLISGCSMPKGLDLDCLHGRAGQDLSDAQGQKELEAQLQDMLDYARDVDQQALG